MIIDSSHYFVSFGVDFNNQFSGNNENAVIQILSIDSAISGARYTE